MLSDGQTLAFDKLLLATGAEPVRLPIAGADLPHVFTLRTLADSQAIIRQASASKVAVVVGASFIGLEVAASLVARGLTVHVVAPESRPLEHVLGPEFGDFIRAEHEAHGVVFHLGHKPAAIEPQKVRPAHWKGWRLPSTRTSSVRRRSSSRIASCRSGSPATRRVSVGQSRGCEWPRYR